MRPHRRRTYLGDPDATAWATAVFVAGAQISQRQRNLTAQLVRTLKATGVWSSLDRLFLFASENSTQALTCLKTRNTATAVNSPTFTALRGYTGNGTSSYIDTLFNPFSGSPNYTQNSGMMAAWSVSGASSGTSVLIGNDDLNVSSIRATLSTRWLYNINSAGAGQFQYITTDQLGFVAVDRPSSTSEKSYKSGALLNTATDSSIAVPNNKFFALAGNNAGVASSFCPLQIGIGCIGASLGDSGQAALYTAARAYMNAIGAA